MSVCELSAPQHSAPEPKHLRHTHTHTKYFFSLIIASIQYSVLVLSADMSPVDLRFYQL